MTEQVSPNELQALRDRIAELEAARNQPQTVNIEGFEGLRQLSSAIENKNLDAFMLDRGMSDKMFRTVVITCVSFAIVMGLFILRSNSDGWFRPVTTATSS